MNPTEHQYLSGQALSDLFAGVVGLIVALVYMWSHPDWWLGASLFAALTVHSIWRGVRAWGEPYVRLGEDQLVVFDGARLKHHVELAAVSSVDQRFNRTILLLRDDTKIPISHSGFVTSSEVQDFRQRLVAKLETTGG